MLVLRESRAALPCAHLDTTSECLSHGQSASVRSTAPPTGRPTPTATRCGPAGGRGSEAGSGTSARHATMSGAGSFIWWLPAKSRKRELGACGFQSSATGDASTTTTRVWTPAGAYTFMYTTPATAIRIGDGPCRIASALRSAPSSCASRRRPPNIATRWSLSGCSARCTSSSVRAAGSHGCAYRVHTRGFQYYRERGPATAWLCHDGNRPNARPLRCYYGHLGAGNSDGLYIALSGLISSAMIAITTLGYLAFTGLTVVFWPLLMSISALGGIAPHNTSQISDEPS